MVISDSDEACAARLSLYAESDITLSFSRPSVSRGVSRGVDRTQSMPGHSMGTLRLRVAPYLGPAQLFAACSTEMQKQLGGLGDAPSEKFEILSFLGRF